MKRLILAALACALLICGCGQRALPRRESSPSLTSPQPQTTFVCHHKIPVEKTGECIKQELEHNGLTPAQPALPGTFGVVFHQQCIDISRYQPSPDFRALRAEGVVCVIIQGADNTSESNPFFDSQVRSAHEAGLKIGVYVYTEGGPSEAQADALGRVAAREGALVTLGYWIDTEQPDAYPHACGIAARLRSAWRAKIVGDYGSPGNVPSWMNQCGLLDFAAEWGGGPAYPAPGFSYSELKFRQWCGTCQLNGVGEVDRDEDLGLIALAHPAPGETASQKRKRETDELHAHENLRALLHGDIERHRCRPGEHNLPREPIKAREAFHTLCGIWIKHGKREITLEAKLRKALT